jgi:peroxiredoxin
VSSVDVVVEHLLAVVVPDVALPATDGSTVRLARLGAGRTVVHADAMTGTPDGWEGFRDRHAELAGAGAAVLGLSTQPTGVQREAARRLGLPFALLSDAALELTSALRLPTAVVEGATVIERLTLVLRDGRIEHVFHPATAGDAHATEVLAWLQAHPD